MNNKNKIEAAFSLKEEIIAWVIADLKEMKLNETVEPLKGNRRCLLESQQQVEIFKAMEKPELLHHSSWNYGNFL